MNSLDQQLTEMGTQLEEDHGPISPDEVLHRGYVAANIAPRPSRWWIAAAAAAIVLVIGLIPIVFSGNGAEEEPIDQPDVTEPQSATPPDVWVVYEIDGSSEEFSPGGHMMIVGPDGEPRVLVGSADDGLLRNCPSFSPDNSLVAYGEGPSLAPGSSLEGVLVVAEFDSVTGTVGNQHRIEIDLSGPPGVARTAPCAEWSPDGRQLAFGTNGGVLVLVDANSGEVQQLPTRSFPIAQGPLRAGGTVPPVEWSPLGDQIAVVTDRFGVRLYPTNGSEPTDVMSLVPNGGSSVESVSWAPDGQRLAVGVETYNESQIPREGSLIWMIDLDGTILAEWPSADLPGSFGPLWSPDGQWIAYGRHDASEERDEIVLIPHAGGEEVHLNPGDTAFYWAGMRWHDAGWIVVLADYEASTRSSIVLVSIDPNVEPHMITDSLGGWPDGLPSTAIAHLES